jgi:hypothetical protein
VPPKALRIPFWARSSSAPHHTSSHGPVLSMFHNLVYCHRISARVHSVSLSEIYRQRSPLFTFLFLHKMHAMRFGRGTNPSPPSALWVLLPPPFGLCEALSIFCESRERSLKSLSLFEAFDLPAGIVTDTGGLRGRWIRKRSSSHPSPAQWSHRGEGSE